MSDSTDPIDAVGGVIGNAAARASRWVLPQEFFTEILPVKDLMEFFERSVKAVTGETIVKKTGQWIRKEIEEDTKAAKALRIKVSEIYKRFLAINPLVRYSGHNGVTWMRATGADSLDRRRGG